METLDKENRLYPAGTVGDNNFNAILEKHAAAYQENDAYLVSGPAPQQDDIVVFVSVVQSQLGAVIDLLVPYLTTRNLSFRIVKNKSIAINLLDGILGFEHIGKVIVIHLPVRSDYQLALEELTQLTSYFKGPAVPGHLHLGGLFYTMPRPDISLKGIAENPKKQRIIKDKYFAFTILKEDARGDVLTGLYFKKFLKPARFVIKEGRKCMRSDGAGRDIKDKLEWQHQIHRELAGLINIPKVVDFFEEQGNTYFVMDFIKGKALSDVIVEIYKERCWVQLPLQDRIRVLTLMRSVTEILSTIHEKGYVHRDLSPANFLVTNKGAVFIIDWEFAYHTTSNYPSPTFGTGTRGFIAPEQKTDTVPTAKEDLYAFGALMLVFFTSLPPVKFDIKNPEFIIQSLYFFTGDYRIANLSAKLLSESPAERPSLKEAGTLIDFLLEETGKAAVKKPDISIPDELELNAVIGAAVEGLIGTAFSKGTGLFNVLGDFDFRTGNTRINHGPGIGLASPITGMLYVLSLIEPDQRNSHVVKFLTDYINFYFSLFYGNQQTYPEGIINGKSGLDLAIHYGVQLGIINKGVYFYDKFRQSFDRMADLTSLGDGVAGQIVALQIILKDRRIADGDQAHQYGIKLLLETQHPEGFWYAELYRKESGKRPGLAYGVAGIVLALINYNAEFPAADYVLAIKKGLKWLKQNIPANDHSLINGMAGIAWVFLLAYQSFKDPDYKNTAEQLLYPLNPHPVTIDASFQTGLAGLGFVYTEAFRITGNKEWLERSNWIYQTFANTFHTDEDAGLTWNIYGKSDLEFDAGLLSGTAGIVLFLIRYQHMLQKMTML